MVKVRQFAKTIPWECKLESNTLLYSTVSEVKGISGYAEEDGTVVIMAGKVTLEMPIEEAKQIAEELMGFCEDCEFRKNLKLELVPRAKGDEEEWEPNTRN